MRYKYVCWLFSALLLLLVWCNNGSVKAGDAVIHCGFGYRSSQQKSIEMQKSVVLKANTTINIEQGEFKIITRHINDGNESPSLVITIEAKKTQRVVTRTLYQFSALSSVKNNFPEFGFTGLNYVYLPDSAAELQYSCSIESF